LAFKTATQGNKILLRNTEVKKCTEQYDKMLDSYLLENPRISETDLNDFNYRLNNTVFIYWGMLNGIWLSKQQERKFLFSDDVAPLPKTKKESK